MTLIQSNITFYVTLNENVECLIERECCIVGRGCLATCSGLLHHHAATSTSGRRREHCFRRLQKIFNGLITLFKWNYLLV